MLVYISQEPYMTPVNPFIQRYREPMIKFLDELSVRCVCQYVCLLRGVVLLEFKYTPERGQI